MAACTQFVDEEENLLLMEAVAFNIGINVAKDCCIFKVHFESDNETLVKILNGEKDNRTTTRLMVMVMKRKLN